MPDDIEVTKAELYYGCLEAPEPKPFAPFHNPEHAAKLVAIFRDYIAERREDNATYDCPLHLKSLDKLERLTDRMEKDGWIR